MFGLFSKKSPLRYLVYRSEVIKFRSMMNDLKGNSADQVQLVYFFDEAGTKMKQLLTASGMDINISDYKSVTPNVLVNKLILIDLHPLNEVVESVVNQFTNKSSMTCYVAIDNSFFEFFGKGNIPKLLDSLGVEENECIEHSMVNAAILNAQKKISAKVSHPKNANSLDDWMKLNLTD